MKRAKVTPLSRIWLTSLYEMENSEFSLNLFCETVFSSYKLQLTTSPSEARVNKESWFSWSIKETFPFCASYTIASLLSSSLPCRPPHGCHICRLRETLWLSYVPVSRFLQVDLNRTSCESAIMHGHCFSDVSHLYSWEWFVMRLQWRPENPSGSMAAPRGRVWSGRRTGSRS